MRHDDETDETDDEFTARARIEHWTAEMGGAPMHDLITWRGRVPDDIAPILETIIEYRRRHPDR